MKHLTKNYTFIGGIHDGKRLDDITGDLLIPGYKDTGKTLNGARVLVPDGVDYFTEEEVKAARDAARILGTP